GAEDGISSVLQRGGGYSQKPVLRAMMVCLIAGLMISPSYGSDEKTSKRDAYEWADLLAKVIGKVRKNYVEEVTDDQIFTAAIRGVLYDLDPHSAYLDEEELDEMQTTTSGKFGGLGIEVSLDKSGYVLVLSPIDDTPAAEAGIKPKDLITHLDGELVQGQTLSEAVDKMRGDPGEPIVLTIYREGEDPFDVEIIRDIIRIKAVRYRMEDDIGYLRITTFNENVLDSLKDAIDELEEQNPIGYVLDLRNNPGGLLDQAIKISDAFLERGEIVSTKGRRAGNIQRFQARSGDLIDAKMMVVIINAGSASASEIVAGALRDHGRAIVVGVKSFGKGSVQTILPLDNGGVAIILTTQRYYTPSGDSIQGKGIEPDIIIEQAVLNKVKLRESHEADLP
ncbi:MAG: S41 family peptidase, partial [Pseudomonadota bacterium]